MNKSILLILLMVLGSTGMAFCQTEPGLKIEKKIPVTGSEKFDFVFTRSVLVGKTQGVPFNASRSGAYSFGIAYGFPIGKSLELKFEPRVLWHKMYFTNTANKWFPTSDSSATLVFEKQRISYFEVPVAIKFKLARNKYIDEKSDETKVGKYKFLVEMGFVFGRRLGSTFKTRHYSGGTLNSPVLPKITVKTNRIEDLAPFRFGPYLRIGTSWLSAYGFYRLSDPFLGYRRYNNTDGSSRAYPNFSKIELGVTVAL
jgi:hypothetical protein